MSVREKVGLGGLWAFLLVCSTPSVPGQAMTFTDESAWLTASVGMGDLVVMDFELPNGTLASDPLFADQYGVTFRPHANGQFPSVSNPAVGFFNQGALGNFLNPGFDEFDHGIVWDFVVPVSSVSWLHNPNDANTYRIYDDLGGLIAELTLSTTDLFGGFVSAVPIKTVTTINVTMPEDGLFGIDDLQFFESAEFCQQDLGSQGPGTVALSVCGEALTQPGSMATLLIEGAPPNAPVFLVVGLTNTPTPILGGTLVPGDALFFPLSVISLTADQAGQVSFPIPGDGGGTITLFLQAVAQNGDVFEFSNAVEMTLGT